MNYRIKKVNRGLYLAPEYRVQIELLFFWITIKRFTDVNHAKALHEAVEYVYSHLGKYGFFYGCEQD